MAGNRYPLEVRPVLPESLARLHDLAGNLSYGWDRRVRALFRRIDADLWDRCDHNPKVFLRRVAQPRIDALAADPDFLAEVRATLETFDRYQAGTDPAQRRVDGLDDPSDLVAYFCMEYGLHESMHLYSGGLGILAGDHCKAAADIGLPFVAVGLMFRQGYFRQTVDAHGQQHAHYEAVELEDLPIEPARDADGEPVLVQIPFPARRVHARVHQARVGHVRILLLDTQVPDNPEADQGITYQLYGGDAETRIAQELVLGIGGVRALRSLGLAPSVWHVNEGHPAFSILERCREHVAAGLDFDTALEAVAAATVFTTHTPVPAGHDRFDAELAGRHLRVLAPELGVDVDPLLALGAESDDPGQFNMTTLALRGSRRHNGVSRVHRGVAACMEHTEWPEVPAQDNPITYVTNGVHVPTFLAREWAELFDAQCPGWRSRVADAAFWAEQVAAIPDQRFWAVRQLLKGHLLEYLGERLTREYERRQWPRGRIRSMQQALAPDNQRTLVIGFARRFATYKRALLLFRDPERLAALLGDPERPVMLVFAGKAHPRDEPGQGLIRELVEHVQAPAFRDRLFFCEDYGMTLARRLVTGVDVWLNNPEYPLEASGTSGQKAAANGVVNVSILDGWWAEGFDGTNGWGLEPHPDHASAAERDAVEAEELLDVLEQEVVPAWYAEDGAGLPGEWLARAKASMATILPRFNAERMVREYAARLYGPAAAQGRRMGTDGGAAARALAAWRARVDRLWPDVELEWAEDPPRAISNGDPARLCVRVRPNGLAADDIRVECLVDGEHPAGEPRPFARAGGDAQALQYTLALAGLPNGLLHLRIRAYPWHPDLAHPLQMGRMRWL